MQAIERSGKTVEEAVAAALKELGCSREQVKVEVLEEPSKGFLGLLGGRPARVLVKKKESARERALAFIKEILAAMELEAGVEIERKGDINTISLKGPDVGILIGRRGETLDALQYLVNLVANKHLEEREKFIVDAENYRQRRVETLQKLALRLADKARRRHQNVVLEPMNPQERRIIHTALQGREDIYTYSEGEEPNRKIVIAPRK